MSPAAWTPPPLPGIAVAAGMSLLRTVTPTSVVVAPALSTPAPARLAVLPESVPPVTVIVPPELMSAPPEPRKPEAELPLAVTLVATSEPPLL